jgi:hypothetical protein
MLAATPDPEKSELLILPIQNAPDYVDLKH